MESKEKFSRSGVANASTLRSYVAQNPHFHSTDRVLPPTVRRWQQSFCSSNSVTSRYRERKRQHGSPSRVLPPAIRRWQWSPRSYDSATSLHRERKLQHGSWRTVPHLSPWHTSSVHTVFRGNTRRTTATSSECCRRRLRRTSREQLEANAPSWKYKKTHFIWMFLLLVSNEPRRTCRMRRETDLRAGNIIKFSSQRENITIPRIMKSIRTIPH